MELIGKLAKRIRRGEIFVVFGRFYAFRRCYGWLFGLAQRFGPASWTGVRPGAAVESRFQTLSVDRALGDLKADGLHLGPVLDRETVREIRDFAEHAPCSRPGLNESFTIDEVREGRLPDGRRVALADVRDVRGCAAIRKIADDPRLFRIARDYLGFWPTRIVQRLYWSPVSELTESERREGFQTIDYHYDVDGYAFLNVYFYLTDTGPGGGPHAVMRGSHSRKPASTLWGSRFHSAETILEYYGEGSQIVIEGPAGTGFIEDPACFHKATAPRSTSRLMLQIRYQSLERRLEETYLTDHRPKEGGASRVAGR